MRPPLLLQLFEFALATLVGYLVGVGAHAIIVPALAPISPSLILPAAVASMLATSLAAWGLTTISALAPILARHGGRRFLPALLVPFWIGFAIAWLTLPGATNIREPRGAVFGIRHIVPDALSQPSEGAQV